MSAPERPWTPGPWECELFHAADGERRYNVFSRRAEEQVLVDIRPGNSHLISAAPEMYEILSMLHALYGDMRVPPVWSAVDAVLAKARGEESDG